MRGTTLSRRLALSSAVLAAVFTVLATAMAVSLYQLDQATADRVERYGPALLRTETLARAYSDQETGLRGYLVGGRDDFLEPYRLGRATERASMRNLRGLLAERADLLRLLAVVRSESASWRTAVAEPAIAEIRAGAADGLTPEEVEQGKIRFDRVRAALADLQRPVRATRDAATDELNGSQRRLMAILAMGLLALGGAAAVVWVGLRRSVTLPLRRLGEEVDRVEAGDLNREVSVSAAPVEIATLAAQVDRMRSRILHEFALAESSRLEALAARATVEAQAEDLRRSNAELEQFAYVASHDLQEPLRKVASFCQLIERRYKGQLDERGEQYIEYAVDGAKRMQQLINDLLAFSRVGRAGIELTRVDLEDVLAQGLRQLDLLLTDTGGVVTHDPLPAVSGDHSLLVQLLQNLIGNAMKFRGDQPPRVHIGAVRSAEHPGMWELSCSDNGIGIEEQYQDKIFVIFQRLHGRDAYGGTGIGLAMCKKIVEHHGGRLWLDTTCTDRPGAVFRFTLPVSRDAPHVAAAGPPASSSRRLVHSPPSREESATP